MLPTSSIAGVIQQNTKFAEFIWDQTLTGHYCLNKLLRLISVLSVYTVIRVYCTALKQNACLLTGHYSSPGVGLQIEK